MDSPIVGCDIKRAIVHELRFMNSSVYMCFSDTAPSANEGVSESLKITKISMVQ